MSKFQAAALLFTLMIAQTGAADEPPEDSVSDTDTDSGWGQNDTGLDSESDTGAEEADTTLSATASASQPEVVEDESSASGDAVPSEDEAQSIEDDDAEAEIAIKASSEKPKGIRGALKKKPGLKIGSQFAGRFTVQDDPLKPGNKFTVSRARVTLKWTQWDLIEAVMKIEGRELFDGEGISSILRDLYVQVQPIPQIGVRLGQFKKPFGRIGNSPWKKFPFIRRGMIDDFINDHLMYGDRDIGVMLEGRLWAPIKLDYEVGVFNGMGPNTTEIALDGGKDIAGRLEAEPISWLEIGVNGSLKIIDSGDLPGFVNQDNFDLVVEDEYPLGYAAQDFIAEHQWMTGKRWMAGADVAFTPDKWRVVAEAMLGENWWFEKYPMLWSAGLFVSYKWKVAKGLSLWLEPAVKGETYTFMDEEMADWRVRLWQVTPALNLHIGKHVRLMLDGELVFAQGTEADVDGSRRDGLWPNEFPGTLGDSKKFLLQLAFGM